MENYLSGLLSYFVIIDPLGVALIFNALCKDQPPAWKRTMALRAVLISCCLALFFGFWGAGLLSRLGIAIDSFRIAGGLLLFYTAFQMVTGPEQKKQSAEHWTEADISVFPLSIPMLAGPGCLTLTILLFADARKGEGAALLPLLLAVVTTYLLTLVCLLASGRVSALVGDTANAILKRLLGVLLASLSIQFIADGVRGLVTG